MSIRYLRQVVLLAAFSSSPVFGQELVVETLERVRLADWITAAQRNPAFEGQTIGVVVRHNSPGAAVEGCGRYRIEFDDVTRGAFEIGPCDPRTNATRLTLLSRSLLFETASGPVPRPREGIQVGAVVILGGTETAGSRPEFESMTSCAILERVFEKNILNPEQPPFEYNPPQYQMVPLDPDVQVQPAQNGWLLSRPFARGQLGIRYEIRDQQGRLVLSDLLSRPLQCGEAELPQQAPPAWPLPPQAPPPPPPPPQAPRPLPQPPVAPAVSQPPGARLVFSALGEYHALPVTSVGAGLAGTGGKSLGLGLDFTLELPSWIQLSLKLSAAKGNALLGAASLTAALTLHLGPGLVLYAGPTETFWGAYYPDNNYLLGANLGVLVGGRLRLFRFAASECFLVVQAINTPWVAGPWTLSAGVGLARR